MKRLLLLLVAATLIPACGDDTTIIINQTGGPVIVPEVVYLADANLEGVNELFASDGNTVINLSGPLVSGGSVLGFAWSPDRQWVAFMADKQTVGRSELFAAPADGSGPAVQVSGLVASFGVVAFTWAPDSSRIAYLANSGSAIELYSTTPTESIGFKRVSGAMVPGGNIFYPSLFPFAWAPDSSRIAYVADQDTDDVFELYASLPDGTGNVKVSGAIVPPLGDVGSFIWAPDGSRIAYRADQDTDDVFEIYSSLPTGPAGNVKVSGTIVPALGEVIEFAWAPDGSRIAYRADQENDMVEEVFTSLPDGTGNVKVSGTIVTPGGYQVSFAWAPDGSRIAYSGYQDAAKIELYTSLPTGAAGNVKISGVLTPALGNVSDFAWAPDASRVAYLADQDSDDVFELYTSLPTGAGGNVKVSGAIAPALGDVQPGFAWTQDGSRIFYRADQRFDDVIELFSTQAASSAAVVNVSQFTYFDADAGSIALR